MTKKRLLVVILAVVLALMVGPNLKARRTTCDQQYAIERQQAAQRLQGCLTYASNGNTVVGCYAMYYASLAGAEAGWIGCKAGECLDENCGG